jgi:Flp pilus assembly pilin Flp
VTRFARLIADESGAALVEYALISAVLSAVMIAALAAIAAECSVRLATTSGKMTSLGTSPP